MKQNLRLFFLTLLCAVFSTAWGQSSQVLFHESFGDNSGSAREWDDSYSVKSGVSAVYSGITGYIVSNVKQGKNTTGSSESGLNQSTKGTDAFIIIGPLNVANYSSLQLSYQWKAGSTKETYYTKAYYATSSTGIYSELEGSAAGETSFVPCNYSLPQAAQVSTLYLKIVFNTSNTQAIIDEVELTGVGSSTSTVAAPTISSVTGNTTFFGSLTVTISADTGLNLYYTLDGSDPRSSDTAIDAQSNTATVTINSTTTINAVAKDADNNFSEVVTKEYQMIVPTPTFSPGAGLYFGEQNVTISAAEGCTISYTTDGSDPIESNEAVTSEGNTATIAVSSNMTINAVAIYAQNNVSEVASATYTIASANDYATLPFAFDGGRDDISETAGLFAEGLGTDYNSSPYLKFDNTGDYLILRFNERPGTLTFNIQGNGFSGGTFKVQTSENGVTFTDLKTYTSVSNSKITETFEEELGANVRYFRWIYTNKSSGNVALGNINLTQYVPKYTLNISSNEHAAINVFYNENNRPKINNGDKVPAGSSILVSVSAETGYQVDGITVTYGNNQNVTLTEESSMSWSFTMPTSDVTVAANVSLIPPSDKLYAKVTSTADLTSGTYLIVYENGNCAFNGSLSTLDAANNNVTASNSDGQIAGTNVLDAATFTYDATTKTLMNVSGKYIGQTTNANGLVSSETTQYVNTISFDEAGNANIVSGGAYLRYNSNSDQQRFRYYSSSGYTNQKPIQLYKLVTYDISINPLAKDGTYYYATVSNLGEGYWTVPAGVTVSTVEVNNEGNLTYPFEATAGQRIPGDGAFLVKSTASGSCSFVKSTSTETVSIGNNNMLYSTGEGNFMTVGPENVDCYFYKLARNSAGADNSVGFYWHKSDGSAFEYPTGHQAYLAVPQSLVHLTSSFTFDGTNGISEIVTSSDTQQIYTISGVRVNSSHLTKGLYIINGKKVIIK